MSEMVRFTQSLGGPKSVDILLRCKIVGWRPRSLSIVAQCRKDSSIKLMPRAILWIRTRVC
jgi:hypothetical protein